jgi:hypothetical protein
MRALLHEGGEPRYPHAAAASDPFGLSAAARG